jgi:uncharacterized membrane protein
MLNKLPAYPLFTGFYVLLITLMLTESLLFAPATLAMGPALAAAVLKVLPLLLFSPWLWRRGSGSVLGLSLILLPYFCMAVLAAYAPGHAGQFALLRCVLIAGLLAGCCLVVRRYGSAGRAAA